MHRTRITRLAVSATVLAALALTGIGATPASAIAGDNRDPGYNTCPASPYTYSTRDLHDRNGYYRGEVQLRVMPNLSYSGNTDCGVAWARAYYRSNDWLSGHDTNGDVIQAYAVRMRSKPVEIALAYCSVKYNDSSRSCYTTQLASRTSAEKVHAEGRGYGEAYGSNWGPWISTAAY
jgi:hypothetical protein